MTKKTQHQYLPNFAGELFADLEAVTEDLVPEEVTGVDSATGTVDGGTLPGLLSFRGFGARGGGRTTRATVCGLSPPDEGVTTLAVENV